jgi:hypothetical protein
VQFSVVVNSVCAGGNHVSMTATAGAQVRTLIYGKGDFAVDFSDFDEVQNAVGYLLRSRVKERAAALGITVDQMTNVQIRTAIEGAPFYL